MPPVDIVINFAKTAFHDISLDEDTHEQDDSRLHHELEDKGATLEFPEGVHAVREAGATPRNRDDGNEAFGPAVGTGGYVGGGGAKAEEDGVSCLAGDEGAIGVEEGAIEETGDQAADEEEERAVSGTDAC